MGSEARNCMSFGKRGVNERLRNLGVEEQTDTYVEEFVQIQGVEPVAQVCLTPNTFECFPELGLKTPRLLANDPMKPKSDRKLTDP